MRNVGHAKMEDGDELPNLHGKTVGKDSDAGCGMQDVKEKGMGQGFLHLHEILVQNEGKQPIIQMTSASEWKNQCRMQRLIADQ